MRESRNPDQPEPDDASDDDENETTDEDALHELLEDLEFEQMMEEPTEGPLSIISDQDVPGEPG